MRLVHIICLNFYNCEGNCAEIAKAYAGNSVLVIAGWGNLWVSSVGAGRTPAQQIRGTGYAAWLSTHAKMPGLFHTRRIQLIQSSH